MSKLKLKVEDLAIVTFEPGPGEESTRGTVRGHESLYEWSCAQTCALTCGIKCFTNGQETCHSPCEAWGGNMTYAANECYTLCGSVETCCDPTQADTCDRWVCENYPPA